MLTKTNFERAIFFSWYCEIGDCKFCYMSTQKTNKLARRTFESILAETLICKELGWEVGFISGGHSAYSKYDFAKLLELITKILDGKVWINIGPLKEEELKMFLPYIKGVVASIETINPKVHDFVCPSKPIQPFLEMFDVASKLGLKKAMTIILGLGETLDDYPLLRDFIEKNNISKIHLYSLNPQKGTYFENHKHISVEYHAKWISMLRQDFSSLDIQFGIWEDKVDTVYELLKAGSNSISKYPAIKRFGSDLSKRIETLSEKAGREFIGSLTKMPDINWEEKVNELNIDSSLKEKILRKLKLYLRQMRKN